jgi:hypothetical protein
MSNMTLLSVHYLILLFLRKKRLYNTGSGKLIILTTTGTLHTPRMRHCNAPCKPREAMHLAAVEPLQ